MKQNSLKILAMLLVKKSKQIFPTTFAINFVIKNLIVMNRVSIIAQYTENFLFFERHD